MTDGDASCGQTSDSRQLRRATAILGRKWHPVLLHTLIVDGPLGFNDMKARVDGISDKVLSEALDDLQESGLVARDVIDDKPVRVEYSLTTAGADLGPIIDALQSWSRDHLTEGQPPT
ncbi:MULTISPECIES: winged helix-turn-helix transcriptional regulator [Haloarcula]|uniref:HxlR family transcriptional regulator n=1 Tax=Haloarcula pellucida TaxID=1427151 RepID=A0A830GQP6_9EURY|nr:MULTISPECIES: helix-turn-helix domain-containing protein [Halomicroarcula]MBX0350190.1 helix-turn-helix transcriptional regulator [Halomicroarcula pellucida]MDS0277708.1 helix-turn-helix transcriptional regulator [Halomicroarcula sp. S1AR25-4]QIO21963.1 helix-turn-helix transcriptional regulator [Haloarcula sp. JP-L23]GGO00819.1 HxlR family transcriptional regulator [Halomicroarcula pellucida]